MRTTLSTDDNDLSERVQTLLDDSLPKLLRVTQRFRIPEHDREDLVQEALISWIEHRESVRNDEAWLVFVLKRRCLMYLRAKRASRVQAMDSALMEAIAAHEPPADHAAFVSELETAIDKLPGKCGPLLRGRYLQGLTTQELALAFGYKESSVRKTCARCLLKLSAEILQRKGVLTRAV